jgi:hypothetical protein
MQPQSLKQEALDAIQRLPETADMEEIMYRLYVLENIRLDELPRLGRKVPELNDDTVREIPLYSIEFFMRSSRTIL